MAVSLLSGVFATSLLVTNLLGSSSGGAAHGNAWVEQTLAAMTVREKAAQMVMPWIPGGHAMTEAELRKAQRWVREQRVGGFIVGRGDGEATRDIVAKLQQGSRTPLLIAADLEWGAAMRLTGSTLFPVSMAVGASGDPKLAYAMAHATATEARRLGVHMAFAPVADVNVNPSNPIINTRAFGENPRVVGEMVAAFTRGIQDGGMLAVAKHFPGHGDTETDSHVALPVIRVDRARLDSVELVPFRHAIEAQVAGIMTAHIALPRITGKLEPATMSYEILTGILRQQLGYDGLIITDALNMAGVGGQEPAQVALRAVKAGADILLQPRNTEVTIDAIVEGVRRGEISQRRLDASVRRILAAKAQARLHQQSETLFQTPTAELRASHARLADSIATRSITLVRDERHLLPANGQASVLSIVYSERGTDPGVAFAHALQEAGLRVQTIRLTRSSTPAQVAAAMNAARSGGSERLVVVSSYTQAAPWRSTLGLPANVRNAVDALAAERPLAYVSFGDPYVVRGLPRVTTYMLAWSESPASQAAAARALIGRASITGKLPIRIPPAYEAGFGIERAAVAFESTPPRDPRFAVEAVAARLAVWR